MKHIPILLLLLLPDVCHSTTQSFQEQTNNLKDKAASFVQLTDATIKDADHAHNLILNTLVTQESYGLKETDVDTPDFYCVIHVVRWADLDKGTVDKQHWYVYRGAKKGKNSWSLDDFQSNRMYGTKGFWLLYVHGNVDGKIYWVEYDSVVTAKIRANLAHLFALAQSFAPTPTKNAPAAGPNGCFGGTYFQSSVPSDIAISAKKVPTPPDTGAAQVIADSQKFDNEGKYVVDFSVGVPIKKVSELSFNSTGNTVSPTATTISNRKALGLIDIHLPPVDVKSTGFSLIPYAVGGIAIASQPLHQILLGGAWGPQFANFYVGALWVKQPNTPVAGQPPKSSFSCQFAFGLNLTVSGFANLKK